MAKMSSSVDRLALPIAIVSSEALWISLVLTAVANGSSHTAQSLPYWGFLLPALAGLSAGEVVRRFLPASWPRIVGAVASFVVLLLLAGGLLASASSVSFVHAAFMPWTVSSKHASSLMTFAYFSVSLILARSIEVALTADRFSRTVRSVTMASIAFFALFLSEATQHSARLDRALTPLEPAFLGYFLLALAMVRMSRAKSVERSVDARQAPASGLAWKLMLGLPLMFVAAVGFLVAGLIGASGAGFRHVLVAAVHGVGWFFTKIGEGISFALVHLALVVAYAIRDLVWLIAGHHVHLSTTTAHHKVAAKARPTPSLHIPTGVTIALLVLFAAALISLIYRLAQHHTVRVPAANSVGERERSSTFSWENLFSQLAGAFHYLVHALSSLGARFLARVFRAKASSAIAELPELEGVRADFLRVLLAARRAGLARGRDETALEFSKRTCEVLHTERFSIGLQALAHSYGAVRYRENEEREGHFDRASVDYLVSALETHAEQRSETEAERTRAAGTAPPGPLLKW